LVQARHAPQSTRQVERPLASGEQMESLYQHLQRVMDRVGFEDRNGEGHLMTRIRRLFNRAQLDQNEINILRGMFTAIEGARRPAGTRAAGQRAADDSAAAAPAADDRPEQSGVPASPRRGPAS
jgi:tRNA C32,U32 (ribose-2'-O)-methylase TrmJ